MNDRLHVDIETFSESDLKAEGLHKYAEHSSTDLVVVCWAVGDGPVNVWMPMPRPASWIFLATVFNPSMP